MTVIMLAHGQTPRAAIAFSQQFSMIILQRHGLGSIAPEMFSPAFQIIHSLVSATATGTANRTNHLFSPPLRRQCRVSPASRS
jgi:hypothetical protein